MPRRTTGEMRREAARAYVYHLLGEAVDQGGRGVKAKIARATDTSPAHITNLSKSKRGMGADFIDRFAERYLAKPIDDFIAEALAWYRQQPEQSRDPSPERAAAARCGLEMKLLPAAVQQTQTEPVPNPDRSARSWLLRMLLRDEELRLELARAGAQVEKRKK